MIQVKALVVIFSDIFFFKQDQKESQTLSRTVG